MQENAELAAGHTMQRVLQKTLAKLGDVKLLRSMGLAGVLPPGLARSEGEETWDQTYEST